MSKKELLERISRAPAEGKAVVRRPAAEPGAPAAPQPPPGGGDAVTTRVSGRVVRRRAQTPGPGETGPAAGGPPVVRRRAAVEVGRIDTTYAETEEEAAPEPARAEPERRDPRRVEARPEGPARARREPTPEPEPVVEPAPVEPEPVVEQREPEPTPEPEPVAEERAPEPEPVAEERAPTPEPEPRQPEVRQPEPRQPERRPEARQPERRPEARQPERRPEPQRGVREPERRPEPVAAAGEEQVDAGVPERPRFEGLGKAVVMPPPGYDPTNPTAFRRRVEQRGPAPRGPAQPQQPAGDENAWRRRRIEEEPPAADRDDRGGQRRGRRSRATPAMGGHDVAAMRRRPRRKGAPGQKASSPGPKASKRKIRVDNLISVGQLAHELGVKAAVVIKELMQMGRMATVNEMLDIDTASLIASEFEYEVENVGFQEEQFLQAAAGVGAEAEEGAIERPPVVTIMGHVDHGKTTLLDAIREAKVAAGEAGGITQHIGAYQVEMDDGEAITFIDTPGHAAFTAMRARGAAATDIVILVVAADDGVQAQTIEAIDHAKAADVPIVVAVNKMDKPGVSPDPIKSKLSELGLQPEDWGGDTMYVPVSALKKQGLDELLEAILLQAEVLELSANPDRPAEGVVLEAKVERGKGPVATVLVQKGTLKRGDNLVLGTVFGRVRAMSDSTGKQVKEAGPSMPVEVFGLSEVPDTGDAFVVVKNEKDARTVAEHRANEKRQASLGQQGRRTAADIFAQAEAASMETLNVILKTDVQGSLEALKGALAAIDVEGADLRVLHAAVGDISESDVNLAAANGALLVGFNVKVDSMARSAAEQQGVVPELYDIIYAVLDRVKARMSGLLGPTFNEVRQGTAEVRAVFSISKVGKIAGCLVTDGKIGRNAGVRVLRDGKLVHEGKISTLKRFKEDVREVASGYECGVGLADFSDIQEGDVLQTFTQEQVVA